MNVIIASLSLSYGFLSLRRGEKSKKKKKLKNPIRMGLHLPHNLGLFSTDGRGERENRRLIHPSWNFFLSLPFP
jgi:hypothetical protein